MRAYDRVVTALRAVVTNTLREPTHLLVTNSFANQLLSDYKELFENDFGYILEYEGKFAKDPDIWDVGDELGLKIVITHVENGFTLLEEITSDSQ